MVLGQSVVDWKKEIGLGAELSTVICTLLKLTKLNDLGNLWPIERQTKRCYIKHGSECTPLL